VLHILFGVYAVSGRERVAPNDGGTANFVFVFTVFVTKSANPVYISDNQN
jgi:hypothetical protein